MSRRSCARCVRSQRAEPSSSQKQSRTLCGVEQRDGPCKIRFISLLRSKGLGALHGGATESGRDSGFSKWGNETGATPTVAATTVSHSWAYLAHKRATAGLASLGAWADLYPRPLPVHYSRSNLKQLMWPPVHRTSTTSYQRRNFHKDRICADSRPQQWQRPGRWMRSSPPKRCERRRLCGDTSRGILDPTTRPLPADKLLRQGRDCDHNPKFFAPDGRQQLQLHNGRRAPAQRVVQALRDVCVSYGMPHRRRGLCHPRRESLVRFSPTGSAGCRCGWR